MLWFSGLSSLIRGAKRRVAKIMKTYKHLFEQVCSFRNLHLAYRKARRGKREKPDVLRFDLEQEAEVIPLVGVERVPVGAGEAEVGR